MRRTVVVVGVLAFAALSAGGSPPSAVDEAAAAKPLRMTVGTLGSIGSLDPRHGDSVIAREVWNLQYPTLTALDPLSLDPTTGVARAWSPTPDGRGWIYKLRELQWSDGNPVTSADVVYSVEHARDEHWPYASGMVDNLAAHQLDSHTVEVRSTGEDRPRPGLFVHVVPAHVYSKVANLDKDVAALGVGDGAWHVVSKSADSVQLDVLGRPAGPPLDQIVFRTYPSADALIDALAQGDADVISGVPTAEVGSLHELPDVTINHARNGMQFVLRLESFPDPRLRRVVSLAIDRTQLVADVVRGVGTPAALEARPGQARRELLALDPSINAEAAIAIPADPTSERVGAFVRKALAAVGMRTIPILDSLFEVVPANMTVMRVRVADKGTDPATWIELFEVDTLQAFRTDNVTGFLREPERRSLVVFGPTVAQYGEIVAAHRPPGEELSNLVYAIGAAVLLALSAAGYWIASRIRRRFVT